MTTTPEIKYGNKLLTPITESRIAMAAKHSGHAAAMLSGIPETLATDPATLESRRALERAQAWSAEQKGWNAKITREINEHRYSNDRHVLSTIADEATRQANLESAGWNRYPHK